MLLESALAMSLKVEKMRVDIETVSSLTAGQTVCDIWHMSPLPANATVARVCLALLQASNQSCCLHSAQVEVSMRRKWMSTNSGRCRLRHSTLLMHVLQ